MSLIAWYPLNGDTKDYSGNENHGTIVSTMIELSNEGKIGQCYERKVVNSSVGHIISKNKVNLSNDFTMACWAYVTGCHVGTANGLVTNHNHSTNRGAGLTVRYVSDSDFRISCNTGTGSSRTYHTYYGTSNIKDKWSHLIVRFVKETQELSLWVNGTKEYTVTYNMACGDDYIAIFGWSTGYLNSANYRPASRINDVRIYDHALSLKEIKELAKAKLLHYSFDDFEELTENVLNFDVLLNSLPDGNTAGFYNQLGTGNYLGVSSEVKFGSNKTLKMVRGSDGNKRCYRTHDLLAGNFCTISAWVYSETPGTHLSIEMNGGNYSWTNTIGNSHSGRGWEELSVTFRESLTSDTRCYYFIYPNHDNPIYVTKFQLELKNYKTSFTLNSRISTITDSSGYNNHASLDISTIPFESKGIIGSKAVEFNRRGVITAPSLNLLTYTYAFWIKPVLGYNNSWRKFLGRSPSGSDRSPGMWFYSTQNAFHLQQKLSNGGNGGGVDIVSMELNEWQHIVFTCEGTPTSTKLKSYYNGGSEQTSTYTVGPMIGEAPLQLMCDANTHYFIDDFQIYATVLSATDVKELYQSRASLDEVGNFQVKEINENSLNVKLQESGTLFANNLSEVNVIDDLVAWYPLNGHTKDISDNENHGIAYGATIVQGKNDLCYDFNGSSYIDCGSPAELILDKGGSISTWFKLRSFNGITWSSTLVGKGGASWPNHHYILFKANGTNKLLFSVSDGTNYLDGGGPYSPDLTLNKWYHVVVTWDSIVKKMYLDGVLVDSVNSAIMPINSAAPVSIGRTGSNGYYTDGLISDVRIYNRALSAEEVGILYSLDQNKAKMKITNNTIYIKEQLKEV